ncbi:hypothetical protein JCM15764A_01600 [Geotalea toluenoxydans]
MAAKVQQNLKGILELWRMEDYERLFTPLEHPPRPGMDLFRPAYVYASRIPPFSRSRVASGF